MTHLERLKELEKTHPEGQHLDRQFIGWMTGTAARAERDPSYRPSVLAEVERFLAHHEAEIIVATPKSDPTSLPVS